MPLPKRDRNVEAAKRTIREAFEDLEQAVSPVDSHEFGSATLESVKQAALDIENQLGARSSLRNMRRLMPLFSGLQHYSATIEVLCNGTPYLPWIWAPIKLILKVSRVEVVAGAISKTIYSVGHFLTCPLHAGCIRLRRGIRADNQSVLANRRVAEQISNPRCDLQSERRLPTDPRRLLRRYSSLTQTSIQIRSTKL